MTTKQQPKIQIINPRYTGATPEMVASNLLKQKPKPYKKLKAEKLKSAYNQ